MSETLGALCDKLSILNVKIWHLQDSLYQWAQMSPEEFEQKAHADIQTVVRNLNTLNLERNLAMTAIDEALAAAVASGTAVVESRVKVTGDPLESP